MPGSKSSKIDMQARLYKVMEWLAAGRTSKEMYALGERNWKISERQVDRYIAKVKDIWAGELKEDTDKQRARMIKEIEAEIKGLKAKYKGTPAGLQAIARMRSQLIMLKGLSRPIRLEHTGEDGGPIKTATTEETIDYSKLSSKTLKEIMDAKIKKK